jgi:hypothetical protein
MLSHSTTCSIPGCIRPPKTHGICHTHYEAARKQRLRAKMMPPETPGEEWRPIIGWEGWYEVSDLGRVRRIRVAAATRPYRVRRLSLAPSARYLHVSLWKSSKAVVRTVHTLVAEAFLGPVPAGHQVHHRNGVSTDNRSGNLEYVTGSYNVADSFQRGRPATRVYRLTAAQREEVRASGESTGILLRRYEVDPGVIRRIRGVLPCLCCPEGVHSRIGRPRRFNLAARL